MPSTLLLLVTNLSEITKFDEYGRIRNKLQLINHLMSDPTEIVQNIISMFQEKVSMFQEIVSMLQIPIPEYRLI